jgi:hypothetical protein
MDQRDSWFVGAVGAMLVAGAEFFGVVMDSVYERMLGVCFEIASKHHFGFAPELTRGIYYHRPAN